MVSGFDMEYYLLDYHASYMHLVCIPWGLNKYGYEWREGRLIYKGVQVRGRLIFEDIDECRLT